METARSRRRPGECGCDNLWVLHDGQRQGSFSSRADSEHFLDVLIPKEWSTVASVPKKSQRLHLEGFSVVAYTYQVVYTGQQQITQHDIYCPSTY